MQIRRILWGILVDLYPRYLRWRYGMDIGKNCRISWKAHLDKSINPKGIHIGDNTWVLSGAMILAHDHCRSLKADTYIGKNCVIGVRSIIMPGLSIGNQVVIGLREQVALLNNSRFVVIISCRSIILKPLIYSIKGNKIIAKTQVDK